MSEAGAPGASAWLAEFRRRRDTRPLGRVWVGVASAQPAPTLLYHGSLCHLVSLRGIDRAAVAAEWIGKNADLVHVRYVHVLSKVAWVAVRNEGQKGAVEDLNSGVHPGCLGRRRVERSFQELVHPSIGAEHESTVRCASTVHEQCRRGSGCLVLRDHRTERFVEKEIAVDDQQ